MMTSLLLLGTSWRQKKPLATDKKKWMVRDHYGESYIPLISDEMNFSYN